MANSESDVARLPRSCSDQESMFNRVAISKGWPTNPLAEHSSTNDLCPTSLRLCFSGHKAGASGKPPRENLMPPDRTADQCSGNLIEP